VNGIYKPNTSDRLKGFDFALMDPALRVIDGGLSVVPGQKLLIVTDAKSMDLSKAIYYASRQQGAEATMFVLEYLGERPHLNLHPDIQHAFAQVEASIFVASALETEANMRRELLQSAANHKVRHAHMVGVTRRSMIHGMNTDPQHIANVAALVRGMLRPRSLLLACSAAGTSLEVKCDPSHRWAEHSGRIRRGRCENLPSGELVTCPADVNGVFVSDGCMSEVFDRPQRLLRDRPVTLQISDGYVREVRCDDADLANDLVAWMQCGPYYDRVGMVSLGTNIGMSDPCGEVICDQIIPGLHLSLGTTTPEKTGASWDTDGQLIFTSYNQDVDLDGRPFLRSGRYLNIR
jgi:leucyl aminopeptidase (aminopeptidase T)